LPIPTKMADLSITAASNSPAGSEAPISTDDFHRAIQGILRTTNAKGSDIASATTTDIGAATAEFVDVTGTTTITGLGTIAAGIVRAVRFTGALTLTHNGTSLILPGGANITTAANDTAIFRSLGSGNWLCIGYKRQSGLPIVLGGTAPADISVPDEAYDATAWNGSLEVPTKNALRDKIVAMEVSSTFSARSSTSQSVATATATKVTLGTEEFDTNSNFATSTFTATIAGYYQFNGGIRGQATNLTNATVYFYKGGSVYRQGGTINLGATNLAQTVSIADVIHLAAAETVELWASVTGTTPIVEFVSATAGPWFSGHLIKAD
jgi:hypothetical protein